MFDSLVPIDHTGSRVRERLMIVAVVLAISVILFAALYFGAQTAG